MTYTIISKADMAHGAYYKGFCRNARVARWDASNNLFVHWRSKFDDVYLETILHSDDGGSWDVFRPFSHLPEEAVEFPIPFKFEGDEFPDPTAQAMHQADVREHEIDRALMNEHADKVEAMPRLKQIAIYAHALRRQQEIYASRSQEAGHALTPLQAACLNTAWDDLPFPIQDALTTDAAKLVDDVLRRKAAREAEEKS